MTRIAGVWSRARSLCIGIVLSAWVAGGVAGNEMWTELFDEQLQKARAGDTYAQYEVGIMYLKGQGVAESREQAVEWLKTAAQAGSEQAAGKLRRMDEQQDKFSELHKQATAGDAESQYELGMMYLKGRGVEKDETRARAWLGKASERGYEKAVTRLGILHYRGEGGPVSHAQAYALFDRVKDESVLAQYYLGEMYAAGEGVEQDYGSAIAWYQKAADGGFSRALGRIINLQEEQEAQQRREREAQQVAHSQPAAPVEKAAPRKSGEPNEAATALPRVSPIRVLMQEQWQRATRPVDYLPSKVTRCEPQGDGLVCFSAVLQRQTGNQTVEYRVKSVVRSTQKNSYLISYRNLVLDVVTDESAEDQDLPGGYDDQVEQGFRIQTGWTNEHTVDCSLVSGRKLECTKDRTHKITLVAG